MQLNSQLITAIVVCLKLQFTEKLLPNISDININEYSVLTNEMSPCLQWTVWVHRKGVCDKMMCAGVTV